MHPKPFSQLINELNKLPGVGTRMAERLTLYLFKRPNDERQALLRALKNLENLQRCRDCGNVSDAELCTFCRDPKRDSRRLCVVWEALDIIPIERTGCFNGLYHVLEHQIDYGPRPDGHNEENFSDLLRRVKERKVEELIVATDPTSEGDAVALRIAQAFRSLPVKISRPARGLTTGADIEHTDELTLRAALENRKNLTKK